MVKLQTTKQQRRTMLYDLDMAMTNIETLPPRDYRKTLEEASKIEVGRALWVMQNRLQAS